MGDDEMGIRVGDSVTKVVVVGGGFGGLQAVRHLAKAPVDVTVIDRNNFHLFQPLVYQVATGSLSAAEIASPIRKVLKRQSNARVVLGEVVDFMPEQKTIAFEPPSGGGSAQSLPYDILIAAAGSHYSYLGHDAWERYAPELKSVQGALDIRGRILTAFEAAEIETDPQARRAFLTFVIVGGGPTGVEMAGQIAELARDTLSGDFHSVNTASARVILVEVAGRVLTSFPECLSERTAQALERLGVSVMVDHAVVDVTAGSVSIRGPDGEVAQVDARTVVWAAGVMASGLANKLAEAVGSEVDRAGRIIVGTDLTVPGHPEIFAIGDMVRVDTGEFGAPPLPGVAPVAMQEGRYVAAAIRDRLAGRPDEAFRYRDKGNLATIGRSKAVADIKGIRISGFLAWILWLVVHIFYLIDFQNRVLVLFRWTLSFITRGRGARIINQVPYSKLPEQRL
jgi:NADH dehydrogenase